MNYTKMQKKLDRVINDCNDALNNLNLTLHILPKDSLLVPKAKTMKNDLVAFMSLNNI